MELQATGGAPSAKANEAPDPSAGTMDAGKRANIDEDFDDEQAPPAANAEGAKQQAAEPLFSPTQPLLSSPLVSEGTSDDSHENNLTTPIKHNSSEASFQGFRPSPPPKPFVSPRIFSKSLYPIRIERPGEQSARLPQCRSPRPKPSPFPSGYRPDPDYPEDQLQSALTAVVTQKKLPPPAMAASLIRFANHMVELAAVDRRYDDANNYREAILKLVDFAESSSSTNQKSESTKEKEERLKKANDMIDEVNKKWDSTIETEQKKSNELLSQIKSRHEKESEEFESKWSDASHLIPFTKPSPALLDLKQKEENLAFSNDFRLAKIVMRQAEILQKEESKDALNRAVAAMKAEYSRMKSRQQKEIECHEEFFTTSIWQLRKEKEKEQKGTQVKIHLLEEGNALRLKRSNPLTASAPILYSPRSIKRPSNTTAKNLPILHIGGLNVRQFIAPKTPDCPRKPFQ